jgi:mRNA-degrading endonuclease RelE of RelBE toxin-antitoxin system
MTDSITKLLSKLSKKDLQRIQKTIAQITALQLDGLDIKTLKGQSDIFRARVGNYRIIFSIEQNKTTRIISVGRRSEDTYKNL